MSVRRSPPHDTASANNEPIVDGASATRASHFRIDTEEASVNTTKLNKLSLFWSKNPTLWFAQVEAGFALSRISIDESKFRYVILNLDSIVLPFIADIVSSPAQNKYEAV